MANLLNCAKENPWKLKTPPGASAYRMYIGPCSGTAAFSGGYGNARGLCFLITDGTTLRGWHYLPDGSGRHVTKPVSAMGNMLAALEHGAHGVVGTSGLTEAGFAQIEVLVRKQQRGVLACGNFALTVVLLQKFAEAAARLIPQWEIIDYAHDDKADAPGGTTRELAFRLSRVRKPEPTVALEQTVGLREARGATVSGSQVHSIRRPVT